MVQQVVSPVELQPPTIEDVRRAIANLAAWLTEAERVMETVPQSDPRWAKGWTIWAERLEAYEHLVRLYGED